MIKKIFFITIFLIGQFQLSFGQTGNTIIATIQYKFKYVKDGQTVIDDVCFLDVSKNESYFYGKGLVENLKRMQEKVAKMSNGSNNIDLGQMDSKDIVRNVCPFKIIKDYSKKKAIMVQYVGQQNLGFVRDSLSSKRWVIAGGTKKINGFLCRKATMKKDTSMITAWFTTEIPLPEGPYYYYGLPGLIIQAASTSGFASELIHLSYNKDPKKEIQSDQYALVTMAQMQKAAANQNAAYKNGQLPNGDVMKQKSDRH